MICLWLPLWFPLLLLLLLIYCSHQSFLSVPQICQARSILGPLLYLFLLPVMFFLCLTRSPPSSLWSNFITSPTSSDHPLGCSSLLSPRDSLACLLLFPTHRRLPTDYKIVLFIVYFLWSPSSPENINCMRAGIFLFCSLFPRIVPCIY